MSLNSRRAPDVQSHYLRNMNWVTLIGIPTLISMFTYASADLRIGEPNSQCHRSFELSEDSSYTVVFDGGNFPRTCLLIFQMSNKTIKDQRYSVCVKRVSYSILDFTLGLRCYMYNGGRWGLNMGCYSTETNKDHITREVDTCTDIGYNMTVVFTNIYGLHDATSQKFEDSYIKLNVYANWNRPDWVIIVIVVSCFLAIFGIVAVGFILVCSKKRKLKKRERRARYATSSNAYQLRTEDQPMRPMNLIHTKKHHRDGIVRLAASPKTYRRSDGTETNSLATVQCVTQYSIDIPVTKQWNETAI